MSEIGPIILKFIAPIVIHAIPDSRVILRNKKRGSGFRLRAPAALTPAKHEARFGMDACNKVVLTLTKKAMELYWRLRRNTPAKDSLGRMENGRSGGDYVHHV